MTLVHLGRTGATWAGQARTSRFACFSTYDLDATFDRVVTTPGVEVRQEPITQSSCVRDIVVLDPAGNVVRITQG
jgi:predicted enzyme related to lactoylglutathione lyase